MQKILDDAFLFSTVMGGECFTLHGKAICSWFLCLTADPLSQKYSFWSYIAIGIATATIVALRHFTCSASTKVLICVVVASLAALSSSLLALHTPSTLVIFLKLFLFSVVIFVIYMEPFLAKPLGRDFWQLMTAAILKGVRYIIALFVGGFAVLKFLSEGSGESKDGFLTTFMYPSMVMLLAIFILGYWLFLPAWEKLVHSFENDERTTDRIDLESDF